MQPLQRDTQRPYKSTCDTEKRCPDCCKTYTITYKTTGAIEGQRHKCGWALCDTCEEFVNQETHVCYIQPLDEGEDAPATKKVPEGEVREDQDVLGVVDGIALVKKDPPLFVYADYESITDAEGVQTPILLGYETSESDECCLIYGPDCTSTFFDTLEELAIDEDGDDCNVIIIFHNLKGFDGMFLLKHCYNTHRDVGHQVFAGAKVYSFSSDRLTFKDSLFFLPFPLASFPATFGLTELCKGFFPHKFNTTENQDYEGPIPDIEFYDADGMAPKKKEDFLRWHAEKRERGYIFNLQADMKSYCESDVKLLKAGCEAFVHDFEKEADFKPLEKCITIASACNRYWRKKRLPTKTIAVEPPRGWKGSQTNQSFAARQWLTWINHTLCRGNPTSGNRIRHSFNGGEVRIHGKLVDGSSIRTKDRIFLIIHEAHQLFMQSCIKEKNREKCEKIIGENGEDAAANAREEQQTS